MKSIVILGDGMSDNPIKALGNKTPLEVANKPHIDSIAREGRCGLLKTIPEGMPFGSAVANLQVLGYDSRTCFNGRGTLEAASIGVDLGDDDVALRLNLISLENGNIASHSSGHISTEEALELIRALNEGLGSSLKGSQPFLIYRGFSFRHLLVLRGQWADDQVDCIPPHDHLGEDFSTLLPKPLDNNKKALKTAEFLNKIIIKSQEILRSHPVNEKRRAMGKLAADSVWPWSPGKRPQMKTMQQLYNVRPAVISAVDLVKGLGIYAGADIINVPGATGLWDTNYEGKAEAVLKALSNYGFVYVHVEATDEAGHAQDAELKVKCVEMLDNRLVRPILEGLDKMRAEVAVSILPDHPTLTETGSHDNQPVPVAVKIPGFPSDSVQVYTEKECAKGALGLLENDQFIRMALGY